MSKKRIFRVVKLVAVLLTASLPLQAQQAASIRGTIRDAQGETITGATVTAINSGTGLQRMTTTGAVGTYALTQLPVGTYVVTVEAEGFQTLVVQSVELNVSDVREVSGQLEVGAVTEVVTVETETVAPATVGGEVAGLVTGEQVRELPLNGRNFLQLTQLMPGVVTPDIFNTKDKGLRGGADMSVAGGRETGNMFTVDGASNNDVGSNRTILVYPSLEAIEEFKIHRNAYGAEFGGASAAQINLVTRGGTNQLRGSVFYFARRGSWNETNYILERSNVEPDDLTRDDYGFTLGGPLIRDKLHFFVSTEWNDEVRGTAVSAGVPTAAEKRGDFSRSNPACRSIPVDPLTKEPFPGGIIPADRIGEAGYDLLQLYPDANTSDCINWVTALNVPTDWNQINARLDWSITDRARFMVRYTQDDWQNPTPSAGGASGLWGDPFPVIDSTFAQPSESLVAQLNNVIGASALNTLTFSRSGNEIAIDHAGDTALQEQIRATNPPNFPAEGKLAYPNTGHPGFWGGGGLAWLFQVSPFFNDLDMMVLKDDYTQIFGKHLFKAGFLYRDGHKVDPTGSGGSGEMPLYWGSAGLGGWGGGTSGNLVADFLLEGMTFGFSEVSQGQEIDLEWTDVEVYVADSWKLRDNMTLDFGIRYSRFSWPENADPNEYLNFNPERFDPALGASPCNGLMQVPGTDPCGDAGFPGASDGPNGALIHQNDNIAPRLGFAWDVFSTGKSVLRAGFGQFFQRERMNIHVGLLTNPPAVQSTNGIRSLDGEIFIPNFVSTGTPSFGVDVNAKTPFMYQYNLTWEQRLGRDSTLEVSYVGSQGRALTRSRDINQVPLNQDIDGNGVDDRLDYVRCNTNDSGCRAQYRPYGVYGDAAITLWGTDGRSDYNSLQAQFVTRFGRGSQLQASYTLADFTADASTLLSSAAGLFPGDSVTDIYRPGSDDGNADGRRRHVFNSSLIYNLPTFAGQGGVKEHLLGNWTVGGILIYASGTPLTVFTRHPGGDLGGTHPADLGSVGYPPNTRPLTTGESCSGSGDLGVLNPAAYTLTGYELGNSGQQMPRGSCDGPDYFQTDLSIYKGFPFKERFNVQLRLEIFNIFNTVNLIGWSADNVFDPPVTLDAPRNQATVVTSTGAPDSTFGLAFGARDAREIQLGVKLSF